MTNGQQNGLTKTQQRLFAKLSDGEPHCYDELFPLLNGCSDEVIDRNSAKSALRKHISVLRDKLAEDPSNEKVIVCVWFHRRAHYRMVRRLHPIDFGTGKQPAL